MAPKKQKTKSETTSKKKNTKMTDVAPVVPASVRGEEVHSAIDATSNTVLLEDVLKANGEEHLFSKIMELIVHEEDDPNTLGRATPQLPNSLWG
ncbi:hypothetical protein PR003_g23945 [Phytophthora rubi]|nr:hypothetical protein PR002_g23230 [Phytophthora rubi]KAE9295718.1 hypothetical protein PR003_g23945 [Phytophthora rubi]